MKRTLPPPKPQTNRFLRFFLTMVFVKKTITIICLTIAFNVYGQVAPLQDHIWYMEKLILNGVDHYVPNSFENDYTTTFSNGTDYSINSPCTPNYIFGTLIYLNNQGIILNEAYVALSVCPGLPGVDEYDLLISEGFIGTNGTINNNFDYAFTNQANNLIILTITNANGDQAIYQNQQLSIADNVQLSKIMLYPNPVKDFLIIQSPDVELEKIEVYDVQGNQVKSFSKDLEKIDMQAFGNGVYFLKIYGEQGVSLKKIVKK